MGLSRFLNKHLFHGEGLWKGDGEAPAILFEGGKVVSVGALNVEGKVTATMLAVGSVNTTALTGSAVTVNTLGFKGSTALSNVWQLIASLDIGAVGIHGSVNSTAVLDVAASGVAVGDLVVGNPVGSIDAGLLWGVAVMSAANVQVRLAYMGSGAYDPGVIPFKFTVIK